MPILNPQILDALREAGLDSSEKEKGTLAKLDEAGLSAADTLETVRFVMENGSNHEKLRAAELSLKARGLLKDQAAPAPSITIVIQDQESKFKVNPILVPRELELAN